MRQTYILLASAALAGALVLPALAAPITYTFDPVALTCEQGDDELNNCVRASETVSTLSVDEDVDDTPSAPEFFEGVVQVNGEITLGQTGEITEDTVDAAILDWSVNISLLDDGEILLERLLTSDNSIVDLFGATLTASETQLAFNTIEGDFEDLEDDDDPEERIGFFAIRTEGEALGGFEDFSAFGFSEGSVFTAAILASFDQITGESLFAGVQDRADVSSLIVARVSPSAPVPLPAAAPLLVCGLGALAAAARRHRR